MPPPPSNCRRPETSMLSRLLSHIVRKFDAFSLETFRFLVLTVPSISENFHAFTVIDTTRMY